MADTDLQKALAALAAKKAQYDLLWQYADGEAPLIYNNEKLREIFRGLDARFTANWCAVVVDAVLDRLEPRTPQVTGDEELSSRLADLWEETGLVNDERSVHEEVAVVGESFVIAWPDADGDGATSPLGVEAFHNDARLVHVEYDADNPRRKRFAAKWWQTEDDKMRLTLYYPDRLEYYVSRQKAKAGAPLRAEAFEPYGDEPSAANPYGVVPVFHFRANPRRPKSELANAIELQNAVNKLLADMMVAAEFGAFKQRWVISQNGIGKLRNSPNEIWDLPSGEAGMQPTAVGQFEPTDLGNYLQAIEKLAAHIGVITRTPKHYFFAQGGDPSGEALLAMEAPLNKKVERLIASLRPTWRELAAFLLTVTGAQVSPRQTAIAYADPRTVQPETLARVRKLEREAGLPLATILRREGWSDAALAQLAADIEAERLQDREFADAVLSAAQRDMDRGEA